MTLNNIRLSACLLRHQYIETLDLTNMISITDDNSPDRNLDASRLNLQMMDGNIKFTVRQYIRNIESFFDFITVKFLIFHSFCPLIVPTGAKCRGPGAVEGLHPLGSRGQWRRTRLTEPLKISWKSDACNI